MPRSNIECLPAGRLFCGPVHDIVGVGLYIVHKQTMMETVNTVIGQNGIGQNGTHIMVGAYGQNGSNFYRFQFN